MHKFKFRFGDKVIVTFHSDEDRLIKRRRKAVFVSKQSSVMAYVIIAKDDRVRNIALKCVTMDYAGTFTLRKARGGWRYNVQGLNGEAITTSEVLKAKQSATEMHERHYRNYKLVDKTVGK